MAQAIFAAAAVDQSRNFRGNISAVIFVDSLDDTALLQKTAADLNQPATTFLMPGEHENEYGIRWFAPDAEIGLCGHGALAASAVLAEEKGMSDVRFKYAGGVINGGSDRKGTCRIETDAIDYKRQAAVPMVLKEGTGIDLKEYFMTGNKHIVTASSEDAVREMKPDFCRLRDYEEFGFIVTAPSKQEGIDFVSRTIVPHVRQLEDHATGSSHAVLTPFWSKMTGKNKLTSLQLSPRGGKFLCEFKGVKVRLTTDYTIAARGDVYL